MRSEDAQGLAVALDDETMWRLSTKRSLIVVLVAGCMGCSSAGSSAPQPSGATALTVEATNPEADAEDVPRDGQIWLRFSEPVVPSSVRLVTKPKAPLRFRFSEAGDRELTYELTEPLARLTRYRVTVEASAQDGDVLDPAYELSFTTGIEPRPEAEQPATVVASPPDGAEGLSLTPTLSLAFSKAMDHASVEQALHFEPEASCAELTWNEESTSLECVVQEALLPATTYTVVLEASASTQGGVPLDEAFRSDFATRPRPRLASTFPVDGGVVGSVEGTFELTFAQGTSMDQAALASAFRYLSPLGHPILGASCFFEKCTITTNEPFAEKQDVSWELSEDAVDNAGVALGEAVHGSFKIGQRVLVTLPAEPELDGSVTASGTVDASGPKLSVGRTASGAVRSLLSFDLMQLPPEMLALSRATLQLNHEATSGAPASLGSLLVYSVEYGASLTAKAFDTPYYSYQTCNLLLQCTSEALDAGLSPSSGNLWTSPVTNLVAHDLDAQSTSSQLRLEFTKDSTSGTGVEVFTSAEAASQQPTLEVEYWAP
jgi:hypothetical protein